MSQSGTATDYMSRKLVTFTPDMDIHLAIRVLLDNRISGAPVVDQRGKLIGILSKKDCLNVAFSTSYHQERGGAVSDFMSTDVQVVDAETDIVEIAQKFVNSGFHRFPVLRDDNLVGVITRHDVLRALEELW